MKIAIIGAGLIGTTTAYYLNQYGHDVSVYERREAAALETSFANAGIITPSLSDPWNAPGAIKKIFNSIGKEDSSLLLRPHVIPSLLGWGIQFSHYSNSKRHIESMISNAKITHYSLQTLQELRQHVTLNYDEITKGVIHIFRDESMLHATSKKACKLEQYNIPYQLLNNHELIKLEPALKDIEDKIVGALYYPSDEAGDAHKFCQQLAEHAAKQGVKFHFNCDISGITLNGSRVQSLQYQSHHVAVDRLIIAAGSYSPCLLKPLGLKLPVQPVKGYSITVPMQNWPTPPTIPVADDDLHAAVTPLDNCMRVAGTAELAGYDLSIKSRRVNNLVNMLKQIYPNFSDYIDANNLSPWCGLRPVTPDGVPVIGETSIEHLYLNTGHSHLGWTMAAGSGKLLADIIEKGTADIDIQPYAYSRF